MKEITAKKITAQNPFKICFVCLGNICRSPTAEGIFQYVVNKRKLGAYFEIDSSGTSAYHTGEGANKNSQTVANRHGIKLHSKAREFAYFDLEYFDLLLAMDSENLTAIHRMDSAHKYHQKTMLLREFDPTPENKEVPDPYDGGQQGFENVFAVIERCCMNLLDELEKHVTK